MKTFTIQNETNHITHHAAAPDAEALANAQRFRNEAGLARLAADWPAARLIDIWNSLPRTTPVRKFRDRATAVSRIWKAIQSLGEAPVTGDASRAPVASDASRHHTTRKAEAAVRPDAVAPQTPDVAPQELPAKTRGANKSPATKKGFRAGSKTGKILDLLNRPGGAPLNEIMQATGWQAHSVRGFISATVGKKMRLTVVSARTVDGERSYSLEA